MELEKTTIPSMPSEPLGQKKKRYDERQRKTDLFALALFALPLVHFIVFWVCINVNALVYPFQDDKTGAWTLDNFKYIFMVISSTDSPILLALFNTVKYFFVDFFAGYVIGLTFAYFIHRKIKGYGFFTIVFMLPEIISSVVLVAIYKNILSITGPIAKYYEGLSGNFFPNLLYNPDSSTNVILVFTLITGFANNLVLFSGTMAKVPEELYESASLDGAGTWRVFFSITLPSIWSTVWILLLFSSMGVLSASGPILLFTQGMYNTTTLNYWFYERAILAGERGIPSALGLCMTLVNSPFVIVCIIVRLKMTDFGEGD